MSFEAACAAAGEKKLTDPHTKHIATKTKSNRPIALRTDALPSFIAFGHQRHDLGPPMCPFLLNRVHARATARFRWPTPYDFAGIPEHRCRLWDRPSGPQIVQLPLPPSPCSPGGGTGSTGCNAPRSEERRVGKECRSRW